MLTKFTALLMLSFFLTSCQLSKVKRNENISSAFLDISELWKSDTCGVYQDRILIAPILEKKRRLLIGKSEEYLVSTFGFPDDEVERDTLMEMYYSLSSIEIYDDGSCGPAAIAGFYFYINKRTNRISHVFSTIH